MDQAQIDSPPVDTAQQALSLEERLKPKIDQAEYLLLLVLALMLWMAGFVDLFTHTSQDAVVFGLYSLPYFALLLLYSTGFLFWGLLIFPANSLTWFKQGLHFIQTRPVLALGSIGAALLYLASMFVWERWAAFPLLQASSALLVLLMVGALLLARPAPQVGIAPWRKIVLSVLGAALLFEVVLQGLAATGLLPAQNYAGLFTHHGRVYQNQEGVTHASANRLGWYYPEFVLADGSRRVVLTGDSFVQGLQVSKEQHMGMQLQALLNSGKELPDTGGSDQLSTEVLALGLPGFGPGLYLDPLLYPYTTQPLQPVEVVVFFHLANDFQTISGPGQAVPYYKIDAEGRVKLHPDDFEMRHNLQHLIIRGYEPVNPVRTAASYSFLFGLADTRFQIQGAPPSSNLHGLNMNQRSAGPMGAASFMFASQASAEREQALAVASGLLSDYHDTLAEQGVQMRLVSIPYFPPEFYIQNSGKNWTNRVDRYDLFLPELDLEAFAAKRSIPYLPLGQYLQASGFSSEEIQELFYQDGSGHLTAEGHALVAEALYHCFYDTGQTCSLP
jgi:hypothetical protein